MEIRIRGKDYNINLVKDSSVRRAVQYSNNTISSLKKLGISEDDIIVSDEKNPLKKLPANVSWYFEGHHCHFSFSKLDKYVDNLQVVSKVIEMSIRDVFEQRMRIDEFIDAFKEDEGFLEKRKKAREFFGLGEDHLDLDEINLRYKQLAKELHPDMPNGDEVKFKKLNEHHKILKRELE